MTAWSKAACAGLDSRIFFVSEDDHNAVDYAIRICDRCPIADACLDFALIHREDGIWGGTTRRQRRRLTYQQAIA